MERTAWTAWRMGVAGVLAIGAGVVSGAGGCHTYEAFDWLQVAPACDGACVPLPPEGYNDPVVLWMGDEADAPRCEDWGATQVAQGRAEPEAAFECPACECSPPICELPEEIGTSVAPFCGGEQRTLEAPAGWDGSCFAADEPLSGVRSIAVTTTAGGCTASAEAFVKPEPKWGKFGRACRTKGEAGACKEGGKVCVAGAGDDPSAEVRVCVAPFEKDECPDYRYPEKVVLYEGADDTRSCTECRCEGSGAECNARITAHSVATCTESALSFPASIAGNCISNALPVTAASMEAEWMVNEPGTCALVPGQPSGSVVPTKPFIYCCALKPKDGE
jgi:hypothetical protein